MKKGLGKRVWLFPDGLRPEEGEYEEKGHEAIMILNTSDSLADIRLTMYFEDEPPQQDRKIVVGARRVRCLRTNKAEDMGGTVPAYNKKYAMLFESSVDVVMQYGVLDPSNRPRHLYTVMGYPCE